MTGTTHRRFSTTAVTALLVALAAAGCSSASDDGSTGPVAPGPNGARDSAPYPPPRPSEGVVRDFAMTDPDEDALSTFALDIDTGSYTRFRDAVLGAGGELVLSERIPKAAIDAMVESAA